MVIIFKIGIQTNLFIIRKEIIYLKIHSAANIPNSDTLQVTLTILISPHVLYNLYLNVGNLCFRDYFTGGSR